MTSTANDTRFPIQLDPQREAHLREVDALLRNYLTRPQHFGTFEIRIECGRILYVRNSEMIKFGK